MERAIRTGCPTGFEARVGNVVMRAFDIPVLLVIYNREDTAEQAVAAIRRVAPSMLFIAADGPNRLKPGDETRVAATRETIERAIDWDCDVTREYAVENLGCRRRVRDAITWAFERASKLILIEDDCVANESFFHFCKTLLLKYESEPRVSCISGATLTSRIDSRYDYRASMVSHCWGWATWKRAWALYDSEMREWPAWRARNALVTELGNAWLAQQWTRVFDLAHAGMIDTWDYAWVFSRWRARMVSLVANVNMVQNVGFDERGTHTRDAGCWMAAMPTHSLSDALRHPPRLEVDRRADAATGRAMFGRESLRSRVVERLRRLGSRAH